MTAFLWVCVGYFFAAACLDIADLAKRANRADWIFPDWIFLVFNTGMAVFAANALWEGV